jgi:hypothetical protein
VGCKAEFDSWVYQMLGKTMELAKQAGYQHYKLICYWVIIPFVYSVERKLTTMDGNSFSFALNLVDDLLPIHGQFQGYTMTKLLHLDTLSTLQLDGWGFGFLFRRGVQSLTSLLSNPKWLSPLFDFIFECRGGGGVNPTSSPISYHTRG